MQSTKRFDPLLAVTAVLAALLAVGVLTFAGPCMHEDGSQAACFAASQAILAAAIASFFAVVAALLLRNQRAQGVLALVAALAGAFAAASPGGLFGLCMVQTMRCWTTMRPFAMVVGVLICLCGVVAAVRAFRSKAGRSS